MQSLRDTAPFYIRDADYAVLVYSLVDRNSFTAVSEWCNFYNDHNMDPYKKFVLVGNKTDLEEQRVVSYEDGQALSEELNCLYFAETCPLRNDTGIREMFCEIGLDSTAPLPFEKVSLDEEPKGGCC